MQDPLFNVETPFAGTWVYVIGNANSSIVKIGKATNVEQRRKSLQTSSPRKLVTRWATPGGRELERWLHARFGHLRIEGEWFDFGALDPVAEVRNAVTSYGAPAQELGMVTSPEIYAERIMLGPEWDDRWPRPDDPDRDHPDYQPDTCGCRRLTPTECAAEGRDPATFLDAYYYTGRPLLGGQPCQGYNH